MRFSNGFKRIFPRAAACAVCLAVLIIQPSCSGLLDDEETYDEFKLDYENQICQVIKRVGYNADGTIYKLTNEVTTQYTYPKIEITTQSGPNAKDIGKILFTYYGNAIEQER